jgi:CRISPR/Cas system CSM-associated protein Csm3 (group 7 of RAMP superfamily)
MSVVKHARWIGEWRIHVRAASVWHIGDGDDLLVDDDGFPFIAGTSVAGALRDVAYSLGVADDSLIDELFGAQSTVRVGQSALYIYDAQIDIAQSAVAFENRPNVRLDGARGSARDRGKFERDYTLPGVVYSLGMRLFAQDEAEYAEKAGVVEDLLIALRDGVVRFGAYRSSGAGQFSLEKVFHVRYNLQDSRQLLAYAAAREVGGVQDCTDDLQHRQANHSALTVAFDAKVDALLVGGHSDYKSSEADFVSIRTDHGKTAIIPGTSLKGLLRHQASKIAYHKCKQSTTAERLLTFLFGSEPLDSQKAKGKSQVEHDDLCAAHVIVNDVRLRNERRFALPTTRINKFTSGVQYGALFKVEPVQGEGRFALLVRPARARMKPEEEYAAHALLMFAVRDVAFGEVSVGGKGGRGFGRLQANEIEITVGNRNVVLHQDGTLSGDTEILQETYLHAWKEVTGA